MNAVVPVSMDTPHGNAHLSSDQKRSFSKRRGAGWQGSRCPTRQQLKAMAISNWGSSQARDVRNPDPGVSTYGLTN
ncbi:unnamed protein product [Fusarium venenatum]|uniref:Uncharacterized protein n=1 Tax=Fusarium venenatum TaxID=56646 RepID=A0A2L2TXW6_9HYPO|nr:uncharacterized protein FVRRES_09703 [Fusarium venenatum]CEI69626.1 unnamed protein product [Fusarium venenatum]